MGFRIFLLHWFAVYCSIFVRKVFNSIDSIDLIQKEWRSFKTTITLSGTRKVTHTIEIRLNRNREHQSVNWICIEDLLTFITIIEFPVHGFHHKCFLHFLCYFYILIRKIEDNIKYLVCLQPMKQCTWTLHACFCCYCLSTNVTFSVIRLNSRHFVLRIVCSFFVLFDFPQWWNRSLLLVQVESSCLHLWLRYDTSIEFRALMQPILYLAQCAADKYKKKIAKLCRINRQQLSSAFDCERSWVYECAVHVAVLKKEWKIKPIQFI